MSKEIAVKEKIFITIDGKEHKLSHEDAVIIRDALNEILGKDRIAWYPYIVPNWTPVAEPWPWDKWYYGTGNDNIQITWTANQ